MSSSTDLEVAKGFLQSSGKKVVFEIRNANGIPIEKRSNLPQEKEVLLPRGKSYEVKKISDMGEYLYIVME